jgi:hypothetical protein
MTTSATFTDSLLSPLDRARTALFVRATRVAVLRPVLLEKRRRIPALLLLHAGAALVLCVLSPTLLLIAGPLLLGVPHLLADLRYLVLRSALSRSLRWLLLGGCAALFLTRLLELLGLGGMARFELGGAALVTLGVIALAAPKLRSARVLVAVALTLTLAVAALVWPRSARLVLSHGHNLVALAVWAFMFCRSRARALSVALGLLSVVVLLLTTPLAWWGFTHGLPAAFGLHAFAAADTLAPGIQDATLALGIVASFAFLQSVHYAVWLHAIPQEATRGEGSLSFRMSFRALVADFGRPLLVLSALVIVAVPLAGIVAPLRTQATYLSLSAFHAYLEIAALALFWVRGRAAARVEPSTSACC